MGVWSHSQHFRVKCFEWGHRQVKQISLDLSSTNASPTQISTQSAFLHRISTFSSRHLIPISSLLNITLKALSAYFLCSRDTSEAF